MRLKPKNPERTKIWLLGSVLGLSINFIQSPANSFVPYFFQPGQKDLSSTSITLGKTAAQLIYFGQIKQATKLAKLAVKLNPKDERLWTVLAETQIRNKLLSEATISLAKAKKINPKNAKLWFAEGSIQLEQKNTRKAIFLTKRGLLIEPDNAYAYFQIGNARIMQSNPYYALKAFQKASKLQPTLWQAFNNQGLVLFEMGKRKEAIKVWQEVLNLNEHPETMLALAAALKQSEKTNQEALDYAKKALAQNPDYISPQHQKEQLWGIKLQEAAKELFKDPELKYDVERALENSQ